MTDHKLTAGQEADFVKWAKVYADAVYKLKQHYTPYLYKVMMHARDKMQKGFDVYDLPKMTDLSQIKMD